MRVLMLTTDLRLGGVELTIINRVHCLRECGVECAVAGLFERSTGPGKARERLEAMGVPTFCAGIDTWLRCWRFGRLVRFVKEFAPDVIHAHLFHGHLASALLRVLGRRAPTVWSYHAAAPRRWLRRRGEDLTRQLCEHNNATPNIMLRANSLRTTQADLVAERTRIANKLKASLKQYFPQAIGWFSDWTTPTAADFILSFPTPEALAEAHDNKIITFLHCHHIGLTQTWKSRLTARHDATPWPSDPPIEAAKSVQAICLAKQLRTLNASLKTYEKHIEALFAKHPDAHIFSSLPGAGPKLAPRLLTHVGSDRERYPSAKPLQALSGTVPVKTRSGRTDIDRFRWACRKDFRNTMFFFALQTIERSVWARAYYDQLRAKGRTHAQALRALGAKWLKIIHRMWRDRKPYDERLYLAALIRHNSPLIAHIRSSKKCEEISTKPLT